MAGSWTGVCVWRGSGLRERAQGQGDPRSTTTKGLGQWFSTNREIIQCFTAHTSIASRISIMRNVLFFFIR